MESLATTAERQVLGGLMLSGDVLPPGLETLRPGDFLSPLHATVFAAILELYARQEPIDQLTVHGAIREPGSAPREGWSVFLGNLTEEAVTTANVLHYAKLVRSESRRRDCLIVLNEALEKVKRESTDADEVMVEASRQLGLLAEGRELTKPVSMRELVSAGMKAIERRHEAKEPPGLQTGFAAVDRVIGGMRPGNLLLLAARPSMGKSALAQGIVDYVSVRAGKRVLWFSFEMSGEEIVDRGLAASGRVNLQRVISGALNDTDWPKLAHAAGRLHHSKTHVIDKGGLTIEEVRSISRTFAARNSDLGLIVVDYVQLMQGVGESREQVVSSISRGLKALAGELRIPVLALSQLNRALEQRNDKRPQLSDLRESGSLEQDANVVMFIYRDDYYDSETEHPGIAEIGVAKNRNGPTRMVKLRWTGEHCRFDSLEDDSPTLPYGAQRIGESQ